MTNVTIPKKVVEQALAALCDTETPAYRPQHGVECLAIYDLRCALDQCEAEDPAKQAWAKTVRLAKVALHEMPRPHTDWMHAAMAVCESVVKVGRNLEQEPVAWGSGDGYWVQHSYKQSRPESEMYNIPFYTHPQPPAEQQDESAYQSGYRDGVVKGREELIAEYPLERDLYDSKDWRCGSYAERVEWLHTMYESAREQIAELEKLKACQEPVAWVSQSVLEWPLRQSEKVAKLTRKAQPGYGFVIPIYTHPQPPRQPLTAEQIERDIGPDEGDREAVNEIVRQVERAHNINQEGEEV